MKKILTLFLVLSFVFLLISCTEAPDPPRVFTTVPTESTAVFLETIDSSVTETTASSQTPPDALQENNHIYRTGHDYNAEMIESKTRILFTYGTQLLYYDKINEVCRAFCFDPLCTHEKRSECFSWKFTGLSWPPEQKMVYMEEKDRIYAQRGEKLYSFLPDGSDVRLECSLGKTGEWGSNDDFAIGTVTGMERYDSFLYIARVDTDTGIPTCFRYNTENGKLENLSPGEDFHLTGWYFFWGDYVYFAAIRNGDYGVYRANPDFSEPERVDGVSISIVEGIDDGNLIYYLEFEWDDEANQNVPIAISAFDLKNGRNERILPFSDKDWRKLLFVTDEWLYFSVNNEFSLGTYWGWGAETKATTTYQAIYKIKKDGTSEPEKLFENMSGGVNELFISGNTALIKRYIRTIDGKDSFFRNYVSKVTVDENGNFTDWEELF